MDLQIWVAFVIAYAALSAIPGPSVIMTVSQALAHGRAAAMICILGDLAGGIVMMAVAFAGIGAVLATSALAFQVLKWAGVLWLAWLGINQIRAARKVTDPLLRSGSRLAAGRAGFLTGVLNPKAIGFYLAFLPQFIAPDHPHLPQLLILGATSTLVAGTVLALYALLASRLRGAFDTARARRNFGYAGGGFMLGGSAVMAATR